MAWSTRELGELAGVSLKTVRHYHSVGLLPEPERSANGYKHYETSHLLRLLQIRRLVELGLSLEQIRDTLGDDRDPRDTALALDAQVAASIERLQRVREELAVVIEHGVPLDTPAGFGSVAQGLSERERGMLAVLSRTLEEGELADIRQLMAEADDDATGAALAALPEDADDATIESVAVAMAASIRRSNERFPWMADVRTVAPRGPRFAEALLGPAVAEMFTPAQLRVLARAQQLASGADPTAS